MNILKQTADGSYTFFNEEIGEHYHSAHGALQESKHVFLKAGLIDFHQLHLQDSYNILEMGFGTGLNFLLSAEYSQKNNILLNYTGIEAYPLLHDQLQETQYLKYIDTDLWNNFLEKYKTSLISPKANLNSEFNPPELEIISGVKLQIWEEKIQNLSFTPQFDIIYFDAFSVRHQPEIWSDQVIYNICSALKPGGLFVSYAITGNLKRALQAAGLSTHKHPGPSGKREMIRAFKPLN
ncbi:MAG: tRNA (5-methylaminomethyl-2-thiouridylate)-methyltransferase [Pedobacter sp.]|nr:MAG: tRNA (5-methylaminomethyl-2-thiouridylate)-methyltransferase [Pedobacter sp.]